MQSMFDVVRAMEHQLTPTQQAAEKYRRELKELKKMNDDGVISQEQMNEAVRQAEKDYNAAAKAAAGFRPEQGPRRSLADQLVAPGGHTRRRAGPGFVDTAASEAAAKEAERARQTILKQITALEQQGKAIGATEEATIRYRIAFGDLADDFKKTGPAFEKRKQELIDAAIAFDKFKAGDELKKANEAIEQQAVDLEAARIEYEQGAAAAYVYLARHGELAKTLDLATDSQAELNAKVQEGADAAARFEQATAVGNIEEMIRATEAEAAAIEAVRIAEEQGAVAGLNYRIAHGDLKKLFEQLGPLAAEYADKLRIATAAEEEAQHVRDAAAASEEYIPDALKAAQHYSLVLEGLAARLKAGTIAQDDYNRAIKEAKKDYEDALKAGDDFSAFMDEAQRAAQQSLADFFYDPLKDGLEGMVKGFADAVRQIAANIAAAKLAEKLFEGMEDQFDKVGGLFSGAGGGLGGILDILGIKIDGRTPPFNPDPSQIPTMAGEIPDPGLGAAVTPLLPDPAMAAASATLTAGATTLTSGATLLTTGSTTLTTAATTFLTGVTGLGTAAGALLTAAQALSGAAAQLAASSAASGMGSGLEEILVTAKHVATGGPISGPGTGISDSIPAWLSHGEYVLRAASVQQPGAEAFLNEFNRVGMKALKGVAALRYLPRMTHAPLTRAPLRFAGGGIVGGTSAKAVAKSPMIIQQSVTINSPNGQVSRQTELQVTAAAARGVKVADRRNN
jgi:hypothetical protein